MEGTYTVPLYSIIYTLRNSRNPFVVRNSRTIIIIVIKTMVLLFDSGRKCTGKFSKRDADGKDHFTKIYSVCLEIKIL